jgi:hypothetical protein
LRVTGHYPLVSSQQLFYSKMQRNRKLVCILYHKRSTIWGRVGQVCAHRHTSVTDRDKEMLFCLSPHTLSLASLTQFHSCLAPLELSSMACNYPRPGTVALTCNPSYSEDRSGGSQFEASGRVGWGISKTLCQSIKLGVGGVHLST